MSVSVSTTDGTQVSVTIDGSTLLSFTTEESSVNVVDGGSTSVSVTNQGPKGDTGETGPQGPAGNDGADGADGQGVPAGGAQFQVLRKVSGTDYDTEWDYTDRVNLEVRFDEAVSKGDPLYITGFNNGQNRITVAKADASDSSKMPSIGLAFADYSQNDNGQVTAMGSLDDVNTQVSPNDFQEGDVLYVKAGGGLTNVKPTGTNLIQNVGKVGRRQQNNGEIVVMAIGRSNDVPNLPSGQAWIGDASGVATPTTLADVATSGDYSDLSGTPTIPSGDLVDDTTPQLGGDLDVNGNKITSASNGDITIDPDGTGAIIMKSDDIQFDGGGTFGGTIRLYESDILGSNFVALQAPLSVASDVTYILPAAPDSGKVLQTDASGNLSWSDRLGSSNATHEGTFNLKALSGGSDALLAFYDDAGDNYVILRAPDVLTSNTTFVLPAADGSANQVLKTDGSGNLSFVDQTTDTNTQNTTTLSFVDSSDDIILRNTTGGAGSGTQDININAGTNITLTHTDANNITIAASGGGGGANMENSTTSPTSVGEVNDGARLLTGHTSASITAGNLVNLTGAGASNVGAQSSTLAATGMLLMATDEADSDELLIEGVIKVSATTTTSLMATNAKIGAPLYMSTTAGAVQTAAPSTSGDIVRVVGHVINAADRVIYFKPDNTWLEL